MLEKHFEDVLHKYPELIEEGLIFSGRQVTVGGKFVDLLFEDRHGQKLIVELKKGPIKREHVAQLLDYEGYFLSAGNPNVRVMLIGNRVPVNFRNSLDHHGFEWREIPVNEIVSFLKAKNDVPLLQHFTEDVEHRPVAKPSPSKNSNPSSGDKASKSGLPQLNHATTFMELVEIINIRSKDVPSCYMDKLLYENVDLPISMILKQIWWPYAEKINDNHFPNIGRVNAHIKVREERGWEFEKKGDLPDQIVRLVGYKKK
jgi:hypothetical protein